MYAQAIGSNAGSLLSGLRSKSPYAKGLAMQSASELNMAREQANQKAGVQQMQTESEQRQQSNRNSAQAASNASQERTQASQLATRQSAFNIGMGFDYAALQRGQRLKLQQALINGLARDF